MIAAGQKPITDFWRLNKPPRKLNSSITPALREYTKNMGAKTAWVFIRPSVSRTVYKNAVIRHSMTAHAKHGKGALNSSNRICLLSHIHKTIANGAAYTRPFIATLSSRAVAMPHGSRVTAKKLPDALFQPLNCEYRKRQSDTQLGIIHDCWKAGLEWRQSLNRWVRCFVNQTILQQNFCTFIRISSCDKFKIALRLLPSRF